MTNAYKVVGIQIVPKTDSNNKKIVNQVSWGSISNCRKIFEKLVAPVNNKFSIDKSLNNQTFSVVGIMDVRQGKNEVLFDMNVSSKSKGLSKEVMQHFQSLVRTVN